MSGFSVNGREVKDLIVLSQDVAPRSDKIGESSPRADLESLPKRSGPFVSSHAASKPEPTMSSPAQAKATSTEGPPESLPRREEPDLYCNSTGDVHGRCSDH